MKINEVIVESEQLDELGLSDVGRGIGKLAGKTAYAAGGLVGGARGAMSAAKAGYDAGKSYVSGQTTGSSARGASSQGYSSADADSDSEEQGSAPTDSISAMSDTELTDLKNKVDAEITTRKTTAANQPKGQQDSAPSKPVRGQMANVNGKDYMFAGNMWVDEKNNPAKGEDLKQIKAMFSRGEIGPPPKERPGTAPQAAQQQAPASNPVPDQKKLIQALSKLTPDQVATVRDMLAAKAQGQQNVAEGIGDAIKAGWNKLKNIGGLSFEQVMAAIEQMTPEAAKGLLAQLPAPKTAGGQGLPGLTAPTLQPKDQGYVTTKMTGSSTPGSITTGGVSQAKAGAAKPAAAQAPSPYGQLAGDEAAFVAAREKEGLTPDQIQTALTNRRARQQKPAGAPPAGQKTYVAPEKSQAKRTTDYDWYKAGGVNPSTKLSDIGQVGASAKKTAANEGFYSKFLGKAI